MADPLSIVAGVVGIIGFGVQIAQILQKEIDEITTATERVEQIVIEIRGTATGLTNLKEFLLEDANASENQIFNEEGRLEVTHIVRHCNTVFRNITVLVAKAGSGVLSQVDLYQRRVEEEHKKRNPSEDIDTDIKLDIELSNLEHLIWPWRLPKIQQYLADMDRLKLSLVLILAVANLAKARRQKTVQTIKAGEKSDTESDTWEGSDAETLVQDEIFYQDQGLREAEQKLKSLTIGPSAPDAATRSRQSAAKLLIQSWPISPSGRGLCSITEIHDAGVILECHAFNFHCLDTHDTVKEMPLNFQTLQQHALRRRHWGTKKPCNVWDTFAALPTDQQETILEFISDRKRLLYGRDRKTSSQNSQYVLISVYRDNSRFQRWLKALKRLLALDAYWFLGRYTLFIVVARVPSDPVSGGNMWDSDSQESDISYDSTYSSDSYPSPRRRSRYRRRRRRERSLSRSVSPGGRQSIAGAVLRKIAGGGAKILRRRFDERRSRSRARSDSSTYEGYDNDDDYAPDPYLPEPYPRRPQRTKTNKTTNNDDDVPNLRRVETLKETDNEHSLPSRRATGDDRVRNEPVVELPPPGRRTTTFKSDTEQIPEIPNHSKSAAANTPAIAKTRSGTGKLSEVPEPGISRRDTTKRSSRGWGLIHRSRTARSRSRSPSRHRNRSRSRSGIIEIIERRRISRSRSRSINRSRRPPFILSSRNRSRRGYSESPYPGRYRVSRPSRRSRRSHREASSGMPLLTSSPSRPIIRTFEDDGIPPTQRDKAAVAEYYLRKWTTAYEHARGGTLYRRGQPLSNPVEPSRSRYRSRSRSRTVRRKSYTRDAPGLIEYGSDPLYSGNDAIAGSSDKYYPFTNDFPPPPQGKSLYEEQKSAEDAPGNGKDAQDEGHRSDPKKGDPAVGTDKSSADVTQKSPEVSRFQEVGEEDEAEVEKDKDNDGRYTLEIPRTDQRAYAESVPDLELGMARRRSQ